MWLTHRYPPTPPTTPERSVVPAPALALLSPLHLFFLLSQHRAACGPLGLAQVTRGKAEPVPTRGFPSPDVLARPSLLAFPDLDGVGVAWGRAVDRHTG
ncbi:hypothetical protein BDZ85DRAFT_264289 [Elsinoe ampelina]|uniref:Uncharacterized protein n=1 Tax=Elsinoe ampelina TaxID=302913 RepID=A0A6A6G825_9PEZI|nr:hypothetical protein BDZ85DRAFT_264289 [Elsinoe ampelina]